MATPEVIAERQALQGIGSDYKEKYGFHDAENYLYKAPKGLNHEIVEKISEFKDEPQWMRQFLAGVGAQYESEVVYHQVNEELEKQGVVFMDMDTALREHEDIVREYFATIIPANDNKLAALNSAVWSGGSFVYVPPGVHVEMPLQAYFRINTENMGQFERTLIIADEGAYVHYVEGCTAPIYKSDSLHSAVVE